MWPTLLNEIRLVVVVIVYKILRSYEIICCSLQVLLTEVDMAELIPIDGGRQRVIILTPCIRGQDCRDARG